MVDKFSFSNALLYEVEFDPKIILLALDFVCFLYHYSGQ